MPLPISLFAWVGLDHANFQLQNIICYSVLPGTNSEVVLGLDGLSAPLVSLTCFLCPLCILAG